MAIVKMNKFKLLSFEYRRDSLLEILQNFNYVHFNDLEVDEDEAYLKEVKNTKRLTALEEKLEKLNYTRDWVNRFSDKDDNSIERLDLKEVYKNANNFIFDLIYDELRKLVKDREDLLNKKQAIDTKISDLGPWKGIGVDINDLYNSDRFFLETGTLSSQFYDNLKKDLVNKDKSLVYRLGEKDKVSYLVALASLDEEEELKESLREYGFSRQVIKADGPVSDELTSLKGAQKDLKENIAKVESSIGAFDKYLKDFYLYESYLENEIKKEASAEYFLKTQTMDVIEGYVPADMSSEFESDLEEVLDERYILDMKEASKDDPLVPIILENNSLVEPYESVVETYALPAYSEVDPSLLVAIFYTIFTGFMIGDLGYGLLGVIGTLGLLKFKDLPKSTEKMVKVFLGISISACAFGFIFGSVFGGIIDVPFGWVDTQTDINSLIMMSLVIGGIALAISVAMNAVIHLKNNRPLDAIYDTVFIYMAVGGIAAFIFTQNKTFLWVMGAGMIGILLFSGRDAETTAGRLGSGFYDVYGLTSWIGDVVSFLRLMALVLSGGFVAYAVNVIVKMMVGGGLAGLVGGVLVFVVFQLFNMFLSYLSAYVHGLRLIYVEMFNKFYQGGGVKFREMIEDTKKIIINKRRK